MLETDSIFNRSAEIVHSVRKKRLLHAVISAEVALAFAFIAYLLRGDSQILTPILGFAVLISVIFIKLLDNEKRLRKQEVEVHKLQKLENIGLLAGGIAHDFNNMLTAILGNISLAQLKLDDNHPANQYLQRSEESIQKATELASQLLTFAKGGDPVKEVIDIYPVIEETVQFDLSGSKVTSTIGSDCDSTLSEFDKGQFQQIISNITMNAVQSMPDGGTLSVKLTDACPAEVTLYELASEKYLKIEISDQGEGMDEDTLNNIFAPYYTTKGNGHGLGMTIVHSIIKKHDAAIDVDSTPGAGTTVSIYLPVVKDDIPAKQLTSQVAPEAIDNLNVLILDDDITILELVTAMFEEKGASVTTAQDGQELISLYHDSLSSTEQYDVVIFDLTIPGGMGGKEAVTEIKKLNENAKCIVSSGYADDPIMANHQKYGFEAAVPKPYNLKNLYQAVTELAAKKSGV